MNTASPSPSRRSRVGVAVTLLIELHHRSGDASPRVGDLLDARRRLLVLPGHQQGPGKIETTKRTRHEPDVEVRAAIPPSIQMYPSHATQRQDGAFDPATDLAEGGSDLGRHVREGVEVPLRCQPHRPREPGPSGVVQSPGPVGPDHVSLGVAAARETGAASSLPSTGWLGQRQLVRGGGTRRSSAWRSHGAIMRRLLHSPLDRPCRPSSTRTRSRGVRVPRPGLEPPSPPSRCRRRPGRWCRHARRAPPAARVDTALRSSSTD